VSTSDLLAACADLGVILDVRLVVEAPPGVITPDIRAALAARKWALTARIAREAIRWDRSARRCDPGLEDETRGLGVRPDEPLAGPTARPIAAAPRSLDDPIYVEPAWVAWARDLPPNEWSRWRARAETLRATLPGELPPIAALEESQRRAWLELAGPAGDVPTLGHP
jgi:hypothetical protein